MLKTVFTTSFYHDNEPNKNYINAHINKYMKHINNPDSIIKYRFIKGRGDLTLLYFNKKSKIIFDRGENVVKYLDWDYSHTDFFQQWRQIVKKNDVLIFPAYLPFIVKKGTGIYKTYNVVIENNMEDLYREWLK
tara:strand:- start:34 stop:435 length:402 start_codon:yes stop_codon:yes gene_type:complete